jgi:3-hydroxybutyryl-CoA dehydrogenase
MKLVEVVRTVQSSDDAVRAVREWCEKIGKTVVQCGDSTGFVVNRLLVPYMLDAMRVYEQGLASRDDIDNAMKLGCGYPMGPLFLTDFVGLDTTLYIAEIMFDEFKEPRFAPPPLLRRMVLAGRHGRKTGRGFYDWSTNPPS